MLALESPNLARKTCHIFKARSHPKLPATPNFIIFNSSRMECAADIVEAFSTSSSSNLINENATHSEMHSMLTSAILPSISFNVPGVITTMIWNKPFHMPGSDGVPPVLVRTASPVIHLLLLNMFSLSLSRAAFESQWETPLLSHTTKRVPWTALRNFALSISTQFYLNLLKMSSKISW